ncbi:ferredoxin [Natronosporangium hydrolyticum]|uniref:Ferredoxin n=1 Tax=Natronosporangium hydrolyticum TaxID=2811111 RepID=A0A895YKB5_9ACTN|nr:ferredoxin [Natronosporangium hydrolyticum]QSB15939.1 ferredoxin [Natronosporangium hydrolyticum]
MHIIVDRDRCEGHGVCEAAAPELFQLDDEGDLVFTREGQPIPKELREPAINSVLTCPVAALKMED